MEENKKFNPAPLGLLGFGMTTILLNLHNAGVLELTIVIAAMGFALGGAAQIIAGIFEFKAGNTFGGTAFIAYGFFWWSLVLIWWNPLGVFEADKISMGFYLLIWGLFTTGMFVGSLKHNLTSKIIFGSLAILFIMLAIGDFINAIDGLSDFKGVTIAAGVVGILCGLAACYSAVGQIINNEFGKTILPL